MSVQATKQYRVVCAKGAGVATAAQLEAVNRYTLAELAAEQVYVRTAYLAHNGIDRDREVFDDALLESFARTLPGKGLFVRHPGGWDGDSGPGTGRWFEARVVTMSLDEARVALREPAMQWPPGVEQAHLLEASFYLPRSDKNAGLIADVDAGVAGDVSIGFAAGDRTPIADAGNNVIAYRLLPPGEALEGSLVWLGAQPGARVVKGAARATSEPEDEMTDEQKAQLAALQAKDAANTQKLGEVEPKAKQYDAIVKALGEEGLDAEQIIRMARDGKAYREDLVDQLIAAKRLVGAVGDKPEDVERAKGYYQAMPVEMLLGEIKAAKAMRPGGQMQGGDPNPGRAREDGEAKGLRDARVTHKALGSAA